MIRLIRYADEGFEDYDCTEWTERYGFPFSWHCREEDGQEPEFLFGCFAFVEEAAEYALHGPLPARCRQKRHEITVPPDTVVWAWNIKPVIKDGKVHRVPYDERFDEQTCIQMPVQVVADRVAFVKKHMRPDEEFGHEWSEVLYSMMDAEGDE